MILVVRRDLTAAHMAMSMLRSSTEVSITNPAEITQATHDLVESRAHSKKSFQVNAPSTSVCSVETMSRPPSSSAHPAVSKCVPYDGFHLQF